MQDRLIDYLQIAGESGLDRRPCPGRHPDLSKHRGRKDADGLSRLHRCRSTILDDGWGGPGIGLGESNLRPERAHGAKSMWSWDNYINAHLSQLQKLIRLKKLGFELIDPEASTMVAGMAYYLSSTYGESWWSETRA